MKKLGKNMFFDLFSIQNIKMEELRKRTVAYFTEHKDYTNKKRDQFLVELKATFLTLYNGEPEFELEINFGNSSQHNGHACFYQISPSGLKHHLSEHLMCISNGNQFVEVMDEWISIVMDEFTCFESVASLAQVNCFASRVIKVQKEFYKEIRYQVELRPFKTPEKALATFKNKT